MNRKNLMKNQIKDGGTKSQIIGILEKGSAHLQSHHGSYFCDHLLVLGCWIKTAQVIKGVGVSSSCWNTNMYKSYEGGGA